MAVKSLLRWAGSKRSLLPTVNDIFSDSHKERYVEPFCGSAVIPLNIEPQEVLLSDINPKLINFFNEFCLDPDYFFDRISTMPASSDIYYKIRSAQKNQTSKRTSALHFLYLNRYCFNGIYRTSKSGFFNVPFSNSRLGQLPPREFYRSCAQRLLRAEIRQSSFEKILLEDVKGSDFVYLDPPYSSKNQRIFHQYDPSTFGVADIKVLADCLKCIDQRGAKFLLSYADVEEINDIKDEWNTTWQSVRRTIAGRSKDRKTVKEVLITNIETR